MRTVLAVVQAYVLTDGTTLYVCNSDPKKSVTGCALEIPLRYAPARRAAGVVGSWDAAASD